MFYFYQIILNEELLELGKHFGTSLLNKLDRISLSLHSYSAYRASDQNYTHAVIYALLQGKKKKLGKSGVKKEGGKQTHHQIEKLLDTVRFGAGLNTFGTARKLLLE